MKIKYTKTANLQLLMGELLKSLDNDSFTRFRNGLDKMHDKIHLIIIDSNKDKIDKIKMATELYKNGLTDLYDNLKEDVPKEYEKIMKIELDLMEAIAEE